MQCKANIKMPFLIADSQNMQSFCIARGRSLLILMRFVRRLRQRQIASPAKTKAFHRSLSICVSIHLMVPSFMHIQRSYFNMIRSTYSVTYKHAL